MPRTFLTDIVTRAISASGAYTGPSITLTASSTTSTPATVKAAASQTADLQQWQNSSGTVLSKIASNGDATLSALTSGSITLTSGGTKKITTAGTELILEQTGDVYGASSLTLTSRFGANGAVFKSSSGFGLVDFSLDPQISGRSQLNIRGEGRDAIYGTIKLGPTPNSVSEVQFLDTTSPGYYMFGTNRTATVVRLGVFGVGVDNPLAQAHIVVSSASTVGGIIQGAASQTADLQQWQNSSGTVLARITSAGRFVSTQSSGDDDQFILANQVFS